MRVPIPLRLRPKSGLPGTRWDLGGTSVGLQWGRWSGGSRVRLGRAGAGRADAVESHRSESQGPQRRGPRRRGPRSQGPRSQEEDNRYDRRGHPPGYRPDRRPRHGFADPGEQAACPRADRPSAGRLHGGCPDRRHSPRAARRPRLPRAGLAVRRRDPLRRRSRTEPAQPHRPYPRHGRAAADHRHPGHLLRRRGHRTGPVRHPAAGGGDDRRDPRGVRPHRRRPAARIRQADGQAETHPDLGRDADRPDRRHSRRHRVPRGRDQPSDRHRPGLPDRAVPPQHGRGPRGRRGGHRRPVAGPAQAEARRDARHPRPAGDGDPRLRALRHRPRRHRPHRRHRHRTRHHQPARDGHRRPAGRSSRRSSR